MMYSCDDSNDLRHAFLTLTCPSAYYMLYRNMSIYCNTLGAIYQYGKIQYRPSSSIEMSWCELFVLSIKSANFLANLLKYILLTDRQVHTDTNVMALLYPCTG